MLTALVLTAALSADPAAGGSEALRRELDQVAARIAALKAAAMEGEEVRRALEPLLVRSQELAEALEQAAPAPPEPASPSASALDLRARADALYQQADAVAGALAATEARIGAALEGLGRTGEPRAAHVSAVSTAPAQCDADAAAPPAALAPLLAERALLKARVRELLVEAAALDDAAERLER